MTIIQDCNDTKLILCIMDVQALLRTVEEGTVTTPGDFKALCEKITDCRNYKICPGIEIEEYEQYKEVIRYDPKSVQIVDFPVKRIESTKCEHWFPLSQSHSVAKKKRETPEVLCHECVQLRRYLQESVRRLSSVTAEDKVQHQQADSFYPMKYLSPQSLQRRKTNVKSVKAKEKRIMKRYVPEEIILDDKQHAEMSQIHSSLDELASDELESIFREGEQQGTQIGSTLRHVWEQDRRVRHDAAKKSFFMDQEKNSKFVCEYAYIYISILVPPGYHY